MDEKKLQKKNLIMYPLGTVGRDMTYALVTNFLLTYILFTRNLSAAQLSAVTAIMVFARIFDALNDPIMGNIIERTRTKWGKFKPWLCAGVLSTSVVVYVMFSSTLQGWSFILFFGIVYLLFSITYTMSDISYWGMVPALGSDANARNQFTSRATLFAGIGGMGATVLIPMLTTGCPRSRRQRQRRLWPDRSDHRDHCSCFYAFTLLGVQEHRETSCAKVPPISFKKIFSTITQNDQLLWMALIFLLQQIGNGLVLGGIGSTYIYFDFGYNGGLYSIFTTIGMAATAFLMIFYPVISRHIHRKKLMSIMMVISAIGYLLMLIPGLFMDPTTAKFAFMVIGYMMANFGQYCYYLIMMISIINTVEYNEYKFGTRDEAIITSLRPFLIKIYICPDCHHYLCRVSDLQCDRLHQPNFRLGKCSGAQCYHGRRKTGDNQRSNRSGRFRADPGTPAVHDDPARCAYVPFLPSLPQAL